MYAFCYANGVIEFSRTIPDGALPVAKGPAKKLREQVSAVARHAYDGETLLVPGIPEAPNQSVALDALFNFRDWVKPNFERHGLEV